MSAAVSAAAVALANERAGFVAPAVRLTPFSAIEPRPVDWLWRHRIPAGTLTMLEGPAGIGKSTVLFDIAARVSRGRALPDGAPTDAGDVLVVGPEDAAATVLRPRLDAAGADVARVHLVELSAADGSAESLLLPRDLERLREAIGLCDTPRMIYLDALNDLLAGSRINDDGEVRAALRPLARLAEETGVAIVATRHFAKSGNRHAAMAGLGSVGFGAVARSILHVYRDDDGRLLLAGAKANLGPLAPTLAFQLEPTGDDSPPRVQWLGTDDRTADDLQREYREDGANGGNRGEAGALAEAADWLRDVLANGPIPKKELLRLAKDEAIARGTLDRARERLGVVVSRSGFPAASVWQLPPVVSTEALLSQAVSRSELETTGDNRTNLETTGAEPELPFIITNPVPEPWSMII